MGQTMIELRKEHQDSLLELVLVMHLLSHIRSVPDRTLLTLANAQCFSDETVSSQSERSCPQNVTPSSFKSLTKYAAVLFQLIPSLSVSGANVCQHNTAATVWMD